MKYMLSERSLHSNNNVQMLHKVVLTKNSKLGHVKFKLLLKKVNKENHCDYIHLKQLVSTCEEWCKEG